MRRKARTDANQGEIVKALRKAGASVEILAQVGHGVPDLLVGKNGKNLLFEIKDMKQPVSQRTLTDDEMEWHAGWRGYVATVYTVEQALLFLGMHTC